MRIFLICGLLIGLSAGVVWAKCDPANSIPIRKEGLYDWGTDFGKLAKKYKTLPVNNISPFFQDQGGKKECISFTDLQQLLTTADEVFKGHRNADVKSFLIAIAGAAKANKPGKSGDTIPKKVDSSVQKTSSTSLSGNGTEGTPKNDGSSTNGSTIAAEKKAKEIEDKFDKVAQEVIVWRGISIALGIIVLALIGLALWLNSTIKDQGRQFKANSKDQERSIRDDLQRQFDKTSKEKIARLTAENQKLQQTNDELLRDLNKLERQVETDMLATRETPVASAELAISPPPVPPTPEPPIAKAFFLSTPTPTADGLCTFLDHRKAQFDPTSSLYRFELVNNNENQAQFRFESTSGTVSGALSYPDTYLQPACEYTGLDSKATRIDTVQPGKATRQGNVWKVIEKARIKFF
ncbi:bZIP transcription factor [Spirosoma pollinicola]|uniref:Uncharacterized protein n=1 Tax=Spirosoma pollinicola TaxID=2057025 RepID=A0A2K8Z865_9BACT|nr:bZIP transcription factor [Spirosoma pollinicola]AUD06009.1 hypothetical protein CWM47_31680 [Spirosoma pollinicola]